MRKVRRLISVLLMAAVPCVAASAPANEWTVAPEQSQILFDYTRNGQPDEGRFTAFQGSGVFERGTPDTATLEIRIDSASIRLADPMATAFATSAEWFNSATYPQVIYRLSKLTPEGGNRYHAAGEVTIRGRTRPVETTITLEIGDTDAHATGTLGLDRTDFRLGVGPSALFVDIAREVSVRFDLTAHPSR